MPVREQPSQSAPHEPARDPRERRLAIDVVDQHRAFRMRLDDVAVMPAAERAAHLLLFEEVPLTNIRKALDAGCGTGFPLIELAERLGPASDVHGIDPWSAGLARARQKLDVRATPNVTLHEGSATSMPFDDGTFDLI